MSLTLLVGIGTLRDRIPNWAQRVWRDVRLIIITLHTVLKRYFLVKVTIVEQHRMSSTCI